MPTPQHATPRPAISPGHCQTLGATLEPDGINFAVWCPEATQMELLLFAFPEDDHPHVITLSNPEFRSTYYWHVKVHGIKAGQIYAWRVRQARPSRHPGVVTGVALLDPYSRRVVFPREFARSQKPDSRPALRCCAKSAAVDLSGYDWENDHAPRHELIKTIIYEMHVRGFTASPSSRLKPELRGTYRGLIEKIPYLKKLGITAVEFLPVFQFDDADALPGKRNYWGYCPMSFFAPHAAYSHDQSLMGPLNEFRDLVKALHRADIEVILDVVYNHTFNIDGSNFQRTFPDYYYRKNADGSYSNGSGCGNETASEKPMMRRFMIESVKYWANEYHIDGFRFDLMGIHDIETMNAIRAALDEINPEIFIYGEGWSAGGCALPSEQLGMKANIPQMPGIAAFSDDIRDALRGPFSDDTAPGWLGKACTKGSGDGMDGLKESIKAGIAGMIEHPQVDYSLVNYSQEPYALQPTQMMSYVSCHDDMCLVDRLKASIPAAKSQTSTLISLDLLAQTAVFTSQGVPFMLSGEELLRTKLGVHNSFESPDSINQLDWTNKERYRAVFAYYKNLIALRRHHPAFRLGDADLVRQHLEFLPTDDCHLAFCLKDNAGGDEWRNIVVLLNSNNDARTVNIPSGDYTIVCRDGLIDEQGLGTVSGQQVTVAPQSAMIMYSQE